MSNLSRQRSWQEDFPRNFFRLFSRSKSQSEDRGEHDADGDADGVDSLPSPDRYLNVTPEAQTGPERWDQDRPEDAHRPGDHDAGGRGDAPPDPPPITPPAFQPGSPVPPVDNFFRRLGSLFVLARAEPGGSQDQPGEDMQEAGEPAHGTRPQEEFRASEQNGGATVNGPSRVPEEAEDVKREDEERRRALSCPPVVTHVTYHGRKIRKMRRSREVGLHAAVPEVEEEHREPGHGPSPTENRSGHERVPSSGYESHASPGPSGVLSDTRISQGGEGADRDLSPSALRTHPEAGSGSPYSASDPPMMADVLTANEADIPAQTLQQQVTSADTATRARPAGASTTSSSYTCPEVTSSCSRDVQLCGSHDPDSDLPEPPSADHIRERAETLRSESEKLMDDILTNALAALERIDASRQEHDEYSEAAKGLLSTQVPSAGLSVHGYEGLQSTLSDGKPGTRSTPSSGYESIAGSDTDIQSSTAMSNDVLQEAGAAPGVDVDCMERNSPPSRCAPSRKSGLIEEWEGRDAASSHELSHRYALNDGDIDHGTDIASVQPGESLSVVTDGQVQGVLQGSGGRFSALQEQTDSLPQCSAKDVLESNKLGQTLGFNHAPPICNKSEDLSQLESIKNSLFPTGIRNQDSNHFVDGDVSEVQSHATSEPRLLSSEGLDSQGSEGGTRCPSSNATTVEPSFLSVKACLASVVEDRDDPSQTESRDSVTSPDSSADDGSRCFRAVKVFFCNVPDDEGQDSSPGPSLERPGGRPAVSARPHLELPGSFAVISEEEENDTVFVNDTGPTLSPGSRRVKVYPFSLSPIYEEDHAREDASRDDGLHVPPATDEEQRSVEQQASSILSLLQSVSERLQSSGFGGSETDPEDVPETPRSFLRPAWDRYDGDDVDPDPPRWGSDLPSIRQLTGTRVGQEPQKKDGDSPRDSPRLSNSERKEEELEKKLGETPNTPFYEYLRSSTVPGLGAELVEIKDVLSHHTEGPALTTVRETEVLGKVNQRPTLLNVFEGPVPEGRRRDLCVDVEDVRDVLFPQATIQARRGCWLLFMDRGYRGSCVLLEEGQSIQTGRESGGTDGPWAGSTFPVGSVRRALKDDGVPEILLHTSGPGRQEPVRLYSEADRIDTDGPVHLSDLTVQSGCWVAYSGAGFTGSRTALEVGGLTTPLMMDPPVSRVMSLRPLRTEGLRVQRPLDPKILVFEKPLFQGRTRELLENTPNLGTGEEPARISSLRVTGGVWVVYSGESYRGQQCVLEEGEYGDCSTFFREPDTELRSFRFLQADFIEPAVSLSGQDEQMEVVDYDVEDLQQTGFMNEANTIDVMSGVWVAYSGTHYTGEQCVLEKGQHPGRLDWGGRKGSPLSIRPVRKESGQENEPEFLLRAYGEASFSGESREFGSEASDCESLIPASFRAIRGSWVLFDEEGFSGNQFVLEEGLYPDLTSCGCMATTIRSLRPIQHSVSEPCVSLFSLSSFEGLETVAESPLETLSGFFTQSLRVISGQWVLYEFRHFKGRQMLLQAGEYPCWGERSGWDTVGSLRPLRQPCVYIRVRSRALGTALTAERTGGRSTPARLWLSPAHRSLQTQLWVYTHNLLKSKVGKSCLTVIGGKALAGTRVALWEEHGRINQRWNINEDGTISSHLNPNLVLDRTGGSGMDRDYLILNEACPDSPTQVWDVEVLL